MVSLKTVATFLGGPLLVIGTLVALIATPAQGIGKGPSEVISERPPAVAPTVDPTEPPSRPLRIEPGATTPAESDISVDELGRMKIQEELRKLQIENDRAESAFGITLMAAPFVTVLVAILTLGFSVLSARRESGRQRQADRELRDRELRQRADEIFTDAIKNIGSGEPRIQAAGASSLLRLSDHASSELQREILVYCTAQLRLGAVDQTRLILKEVFQRAVVVVLKDPNSEQLPELSLRKADLTRVRLRELDLCKAGLDLTEADLTGADLYGSNLWKVGARGVSLERSDCRNVNFGPADLRESNCKKALLRGALLASAKLQKANLAGADLRGAKLQSAHFEGAIISGTNFAQADVNDAYFINVTMDEYTRTSLGTARNVEKAHFSTPLNGLTAK